MPTAAEKSSSAAAAAGDYATLRELYLPHIESFDYFLDEGLDKMLLSIRPMEITDPSSNATLRMSLEKGHVLPPMKDGRLGQPLYPQECRQGRISYSGEFKVEAFFQFNDGAPIRQTFNFGHLPIMLMSKLCHLRGADSRKLIYHGEEATEMGGYFISGGMERLIRILIVQKRNYPMGMVRSSFVKRGEGYTDKAVVIRYCLLVALSFQLPIFYLLVLDA